MRFRPLACLVLACGSSASADVIANWNFNDLVGGSVPTSISASRGVGTIFADGTAGSSVWSPSGSIELTAFSGSTTNAIESDASGNALALVNSNANGKGIVFAVDMSGHESLSISYATRGTGTGFTSQQWSWSADGVNFTALETIASQNSSTWVVKSLATVSTLDGVSTAYLRLVVDGASSTNGNNRFDNVVFDALPSTPVVPGPAAAAALAAIGMTRRRRR